MHLYALTRGIKHEIDNWVNDMCAQYFPYAGGKIMVQLSMRPVQLWEIVAPKEALPELLKIMHWDGNYRKDIKAHMTVLRKILNAKKIPKFDYSKVPTRITRNSLVAMYPIGFKPDKLWETGDFKGFEQL